MKRHFLDRLQRRLGRFAIPNLTMILIAGQVAVFFLATVRAELLEDMVLVPGAVFRGQAWRLLTFLFIPPAVPGDALSLVLAIFFWMLLHLMGTALESFWGTFRYNIYLLVGYLATVAAACLTPGAPATNLLLLGSVFLAFAYLNPNFVIYVFFLFPLKIKWLALLTWIGYGATFVFGGWMTRLAVLASVANFLLFFGREIYQRIQTGRRRMATEVRQQVAVQQPFHRCLVCGITDKSHPNTEFRYCSKCIGTCGYCPDHIRNHEHVTADDGDIGTKAEGGRGKAEEETRRDIGT
jgi:hypothetical protein